MNLTLNHFITLSGLLFSIGLMGALVNKRHFIIVLLSVELMLLATNINLVAFSYFLKDYAGQVFVIFILTVAAAEAAIGLAILVLYFRKHDTIDINSATQLKG